MKSPCNSTSASFSLTALIYTSNLPSSAMGRVRPLYAVHRGKAGFHLSFRRMSRDEEPT
jgi:hypothetical protein